MNSLQDKCCSRTDTVSYGDLRASEPHPIFNHYLPSRMKSSLDILSPELLPWPYQPELANPTRLVISALK